MFKLTTYIRRLTLSLLALAMLVGVISGCGHKADLILPPPDTKDTSGQPAK